MKKIIPLVGGEENANYSLLVDLGDYSYEFILHYQQNGQWSIDVVADGDVGDVPTVTVNSKKYIAMGAMLEGGSDIVSEHMISSNFGQLFFFGEDATLDNLGSENKLVWYSPDEVILF